MATLEDAIVIATQAHREQKDKAGAPYILHPLRLMLHMKSEAAMMAAVLHDVVEDSDWTLEMLREKDFTEEVLNAIECLTRKDGETYDEFIERIKMNPLARQVKIADLEDNMDAKRLSKLTDKDTERIAKYRKAWASLMKPTSDPNKDCNCLINAPQSLDFKELGMDKSYAEVSVSKCDKCGRHWLRYFSEDEGFTASGRWYLGAITSEQFAELTLENAKRMLESLDWYYCGGSYYGGRVSKTSGAI